MVRPTGAAAVAAPGPTSREKLTVLGRELAMRRRVYPGFVKSKRMDQADADREIAVMAAIRDDYAAKVIEEEAKTAPGLPL